MTDCYLCTTNDPLWRWALHTAKTSLSQEERRQRGVEWEGRAIAGKGRCKDKERVRGAKQSEEVQGSLQTEAGRC